MSTLHNVSYDQFKAAASEFFALTQRGQQVTHEEAESGFKALSIFYFNGSNEWSEFELYSAAVILELASTRCLELALAAINGTADINQDTSSIYDYID